MEFVNNFTRGLNKDLAKSLYQPTNYLHSENGQLVTEIGSSTGIWRNIKGNELFFTIPGCSNVVEITRGTANAAFQIVIATIFGSTSVLIDLTIDSWQKPFANTVNTNATLQSWGVHAAYNNDRVVLYSLLDSTNTLLTPAINASSNPHGHNINNAYVAGTPQPKIMGWGKLRDDFIIFTADTTSSQPTGETGQVWRVSYNRFTFEVQIKLVYNNNLNFSIAYPIANPTQFVSNFEIDTIQKIYFTDNYNTPKGLNIVDPNRMALDLSILENTPSYDLGNIVPQDILQSGGILKTGDYQLAYRLKKTSGSTTSFMMPCNPLPLTGINDLTSTTTEYQGSALGVATTKQITYKIYNLDTSFDRVEIVSIYRASATGNPEINIVADEPIPSTGILDFTLTGREPAIPITLDEYISSNINFQTVKTIASKNNYLFYGNVKYSDFDVDFDTRAFRYNHAGVTYNNADDHNPNQEPYSANNFLYKSDGVTLGGEGANVSFEFTNTTDDPGTIELDNRNISGLATADNYASSSRQSHTYNFGQGAYTSYPCTGNIKNFHSPFVQAALKGYQRDETYRFGVVFYSTKGEKSFVHWIADIRMPHTYMPDLDPVTNPTGDPLIRSLQFPISDSVAAVPCVAWVLGIKFTISNLNTISNQISGYSIVRVKREDSDRSILDQGTFNVGWYNAGTGRHYTVTEIFPPTFGANNEVSNGLASFNSPKFLFDSYQGFNSTDYIEILGTIGLNQAGACTVDGTGQGNKLVLKNFSYASTQCSPINNTTRQGKYLLRSTLMAQNAYLELPNTSVYTLGIIPRACNFSNNSIFGETRSYGGKTLMLDGNFSDFGSNPGDLNYAFADGIVTDGLNPAHDRVYLANYKRDVSNQYGGFTNAAKSLNEYISTGHVVILQDNVTSYTSFVFGGDTYVCLFDNVKQFGNGPDVNINGDAPVSYALSNLMGRFVPVECFFNLDWRTNPGSSVFNKNALTGVQTLANIDTVEEFRIFFDYMQENNVMLFFPRPDPFILRNNYDVRIHKSGLKINGELIESWGVFKEDEYIDLDTAQGQLNALIVHQDRLFGFQDRGISVTAVNERALTQDLSGAELTLGTAGVLSRYDYISKVIGSKHIHSFTQSHDAIFFFDINTKNIYKMTGTSPVSITVAKGLSSYISNNLNGLLQISDNPYLNKGVTSTYDFRYNEAIMTFRDLVFSSGTKGTLFNLSPVQISFRSGSYPDCIEVDQEVVVEFTVNNQPVLEVFTVIAAVGNTITLSSDFTQLDNADSPEVSVACATKKAFTIAYNDFIDAFTSFYSFTPAVYLNDLNLIVSPSSPLVQFYRHGSGEYGRFYGALYPSKLSLIINPYPTETKVFDNYEMVTDGIDDNNFANPVNLPDETFDTIRIYDDYQNTDFRDVTEVSRRKERTWNLSYLRNRVLYNTVPTDIFAPSELSLTDKSFGERMRDKYIIVDLSYDNAANNRLQLSSFKTVYKRSPR